MKLPLQNIKQMEPHIELLGGGGLTSILQAPNLNELWTIRTLANSALVNLNPKIFDPSQFGPRPLVNSDLDHWPIRAFLLDNSDLKKKNSLVNSDLLSWSTRTFSIGQIGPFLLVNSDLFHWSIQTFSVGQFGPFSLVSSDLCIMYFP